MERNTIGHHGEHSLDGPRALKPHEYSAALRLINSVFRPNGPYTMQNDYPLVLGMDNIENMRVIAKGDEIISHAAIYFSTVRSGDLTFKVGGISSVATDPAYRGKGLASRVMRDCLRVMREHSCHISFLWTDRHDFYRNFGYEPSGSSYMFMPTPEILSNASLDCEIAHYSPEHLPEIIEIHDRESNLTERTFNEYTTYFALPKIETLIALRDGKVSAYAVMGNGKDLPGFIYECGGVPCDILRLIREFTTLSETGNVYILAPAFENDLTAFLTEMNAPKAYMRLTMFNVIDVSGLSSVVNGYVSNRLHRDFRITEDSSGVQIKIGREQAYVEPARMLASILFGPEPPSSFLNGFSRETLSLLDKILPIPLFVWILDWV